MSLSGSLEVGRSHGRRSNNRPEGSKGEGRISSPLLVLVLVIVHLWAFLLLLDENHCPKGFLKGREAILGAKGVKHGFTPETFCTMGRPARGCWEVVSLVLVCLDGKGCKASERSLFGGF